MRNSLLLIGLLVFGLIVRAQPGIIFKIDTICHTPPGIVVVPVKVLNFIEVGSISLTINYDINTLYFTNQWSINPALAGGFATLNENIITHTISFAWFGLNPVQLSDNDIFISLEFSHLYGSGFVNFIPNPSNTYINGMVTGGPVQITQQPDTIIVHYDSSAYFQAATNISAGILYQWQESTDNGLSWNNLLNGGHYSGTNTGLLKIDTVSLTMNGFLYRCNIGNCGGGLTDIALLEVYGNTSLSGYLTYLNAASSPVSATDIFFWKNGNLDYTITTDTNGYFQIPLMIADTYDITFNCLKPWGGGNGIDGLLILKHFTGMISLTGLPLQAADVDFSGIVTPIDALWDIKRFAGMLNSFPNGDWVFDTSQVIILPNQPNNITIRSLCTGDVNGSFTP